MFQTKCTVLEEQLTKINENSESELKRLVREKAILQEKHTSLEKTYENLRTQHEYLQYKSDESTKEWVKREEQLDSEVKTK